MGDAYFEEMIVRKKTWQNRLACIGLILLALFLWTESYLWGFSLFCLIPACLVTAFDCYQLPRMNIEWEYTYVDAELDVDKIFNRSKRKRMGTYEIKKAEVIAPAHSHRLDYYNSNPKIKAVDYTSRYPQREKKVYAMVIESEKKGLEKILFEPSQEMLDDMRRRAPHKVYMD